MDNGSDPDVVDTQFYDESGISIAVTNSRTLKRRHGLVDAGADGYVEDSSRVYEQTPV